MLPTELPEVRLLSRLLLMKTIITIMIIMTIMLLLLIIIISVIIIIIIIMYDRVMPTELPEVRLLSRLLMMITIQYSNRNGYESCTTVDSRL